ncbi:MAG: response regulator [Eubacteriales bacterium]|nr:response regulator [Eubacteriales bacterium]
MSLYSVLMVDDEDEVIQIIRRKIPWEELGFVVCGQAKNGIEALEMVEELQPDVVMTDIKMPYMDGLEFASQLKEKYPDIRIIIFSGFDEFEYAKQAIGLEVEEYLLKPMDAVEIRRIFEKVKTSIDAKRDLQKNIEHLEKYYEKSLPILQEGFLSSLIEGGIPEEQMKSYLEEYHIHFDSPYYAVTIVHTSLKSTPKGMSPRLYQLSVRQLLELGSFTERNHYIFNYRNNIVSITEFQTKEEISKYTDICDRFCKAAKRSLNAVVSIGIGKIVDSLNELSLSYQGAREAVSYRTIFGAGNAINIIEIDPKSNKLQLKENNSIEEIFKQMKMGSEDDLLSAVEKYMASLHRVNLNLQDLHFSLMDLLSSLYRFLQNNEVNTNMIQEESGDIYGSLLQMDSLEDIGNWLRNTSLNIRKVVQEQRKSKTGSIVRNAENYVKEHYNNPELSIDLVCSELGVSSSYFSTIFKKETGKTFINYLTEYRMKEAERLLMEEDEKKYIIAEKVGYLDPSYFSYVFKKWFGMSPMKYKNRGNTK